MEHQVIRIRKIDYLKLKEKAKQDRRPLVDVVSLLLEGEKPEQQAKANPGKPNIKPPSDPRFQGIKEIFFDTWKQNQGFAYTGFTAADGSHIKQIIKKLDSLNENNGDIVEFFRIIMNNLPNWYKNQNLKVINSKFNELIAEIRSKRQSNSRGWDNIRPEHDWRI